MNIFFIASEATPLAKTGGLADVVGALPQAFGKPHKTTVIMPFYRDLIMKSGHEIHALNRSVTIWIDGHERVCPIHQIKINRVTYWLVEQDDLYNREGLYGQHGGGYADNLLRFVLFNRVALELAAAAEQPADILHCHDWQTGMIPLLLKTQYRHRPGLEQTRVIFSIHNLAYQGIFPADWNYRLGLPVEYFHADGYEFYGQINCMKAAIVAADAVNTVSQTYAQEILTPEYGCHLEGFLAQHKDKLTGITNGIDTDIWNPERDPFLAQNYSIRRPNKGKADCKQALQRHCGLDIRAEAPVLGIVSRLADQKGIDLIIPNIQPWLGAGCQMVVLGSGDPAYEKQLNHLAAIYSRHMYVCNDFDEPLAHQIYAGSDMLLMPSRFEPCGLSQMIAMHYGTLPVVRATGGLADTVTNYFQSRQAGTGFMFNEATPEALDKVLRQAVGLFREKPRVWSRLRNNAMRQDVSWTASARSYIMLYNRTRLKAL
ncbi:MAG: glycogen synthase GlgA [Gammaproteobacteria bacterium]|nr:MAG: glycogen synthase GlgA [Gammaproteobacteria bacterium]